MDKSDQSLVTLDKHDWTLQEQKIFLFLVSRADSMKDSRTITVAVKEFADMTGITNRGSIYQELEKATKRMLGRVFCVRAENETTQFQVLSRAKYLHKEGRVKLTVHEDMKPYLLKIGKSFTVCELKNISKITSSYALRIYELVRSGEAAYGIDDLRDRLGVKAGELINFAHFDRRVLEISRREINGKTDLRLEYEVVKEGRKVARIRFRVKHAKRNLTRVPAGPLETSSLTDALISGEKSASCPSAATSVFRRVGIFARSLFSKFFKSV